MTAVPTHHIKGEVCGSRSAYREGRLPKAVKVYTVNQESSYVLAQGVPAVGGGETLVKLFAVYGEIEEYRILDDYPSEEFTDVYLFKFKKIQAARFAKRKIDDYSFLGGVLHVCYAPEYETIEETREKLQNRRKIVAVKIRQHAPRIEPRPHEETERTAIVLESLPQVNESVPDFNRSTLFSENRISLNHEGENNVQCDSSIGQDSCIPEENFSLPPPPIDLGPRFRSPHVARQCHGRVPCAHSTLPANYDGRLNQTNFASSTSDICCNHESNSLTQSGNKSSQAATSKPKDKIVNGLVVRDYKKPGKTPQFIPRQAIKKPVKDDNISKTVSDSLDKELRCNAFTLGASQGPTKPGEKDKVVINPDNQLSVNKTVKDIRKRISKFISEKVPNLKKSKAS